MSSPAVVVKRLSTPRWVSNSQTSESVAPRRKTATRSPPGDGVGPTGLRHGFAEPFNLAAGAVDPDERRCRRPSRRGTPRSRPGGDGDVVAGIAHDAVSYRRRAAADFQLGGVERLGVERAVAHEEQVPRRVDGRRIRIEQSRRRQSVELTDVDAAGVRAADDEVEEVTAIRQEVREGVPGVSGSERGHSGRWCAVRRRAENRTGRGRRKQDRAVGIPRPADARRWPSPVAGPARRRSPVAGDYRRGRTRGTVRPGTRTDTFRRRCRQRTRRRRVEPAQEQLRAPLATPVATTWVPSGDSANDAGSWGSTTAAS